MDSMKRYSILFLLAAFMTFLLVSGGVSAQTDPDGDGVFGAKDRCPTVAGPASNNGCPLPTTNNNNTTPPEQPPLHPPGDSDGDGTLDVNDKCPLDGGPDWNN